MDDVVLLLLVVLRVVEFSVSSKPLSSFFLAGILLAALLVLAVLLSSCNLPFSRVFFCEIDRPVISAPSLRLAWLFITHHDRHNKVVEHGRQGHKVGEAKNEGIRLL